MFWRPASRGLQQSSAGRSGQFLVGLALIACLALPAGVLGQESEAFEPEVIDLSPDDGPVSWGLRNVLAPFTWIFFGSPKYWYGEHRIQVDTTPSGGIVDLFYIRANFQKRFEQAETPVTVLLPPRIEASARDALTIRAFAEGYKQESVTIKVNSRTDEIVIDLSPLPNLLEVFAHTYFAGRSALTFLTQEALTFRLQEADSGFSVILTETGRSLEATASLESVSSPIVEEIYGQQLGEDLLVRVAFNAGVAEPEVRSRQGYDAARELHSFTLDLIPADGGRDVVARALAALGKLRPVDVSGCALKFDAELRDQLDAGSLSRALTPSGAFTDPYLRAGMRRLGELSSGGTVEFGGGARFRPGVPIELEAALSQAGDAAGYLALLRSFVRELETETYRRETLRSLIAPEMASDVFGLAIDAGERAEGACSASL